MNTTSCAGQPKQHQTIPIRNRQDLSQLCHVALVIIEKYVGRSYVSRLNWIIRKNRGSVTLQNLDVLGELITVFKDYDNQLAQKAGRSLHQDPVVVAVALCDRPKFARECMRARLQEMYGGLYYINPDNDHDSEYFLAPQPSNHFDIIFLPQGPCDEVDELTLNHLINLFTEKADGYEVKISDLFENGTYSHQSNARGSLVDHYEADSGANGRGS